MGRLHRADSQAELGVISGKWLVVNEQATVRFKKGFRIVNPTKKRGSKYYCLF